MILAPCGTRNDWPIAMRLKFVAAENPDETAFLSALAEHGDMLLVDDEVNADGCFAFLTKASLATPVVTDRDRIATALTWHGVEQPFLGTLLAALSTKGGQKRRLAGALRATLRFTELPPADRSRFMLVGPPAAGKTTLVAKLAARPGEKIPAIFTTDWVRPGGFEQLAEFLRVLGHEPIALDPDHLLRTTAHGMDPDDPIATGPVLIDTGGIDGHDHAAWSQLGQLAASLNVEPILVLPAPIAPDEAQCFAEAAITIGAKKLIATRLDIGHRMGALLKAAHCGLALAGGCTTPHFSFGLKTLTPALTAHHLLLSSSPHTNPSA